MNTEGIDFAEKLLAATRDDLVQAEAKAAILMAAAGVGVSALLGGLISAGWSPARLENAIEWLWWLGIGCVVGGLGFLGDAIYPRLRINPRQDPITYFGDVVATPRDDLSRRIEASARPGGATLLTRLNQLSLLVDRKYRSIRRSLLLLGGSAVLCSGSALVNMMLQ